jgi:anti-sigma factor RsiW
VTIAKTGKKRFLACLPLLHLLALAVVAAAIAAVAVVVEAVVAEALAVEAVVAEALAVEAVAAAVAVGVGNYPQRIYLPG